MATKRKSELQQQCMQLGIPSEGTCDELMDRIRDCFIDKQHLSVTPQIPPMLAANAKDYLDYSLEKPWRTPFLLDLFKSPDIVIETKFDGVRVKAHFHQSYPVSPRLDSRVRSDINFIYSEKTANFPHLYVDANLLPEPMRDMIIDGEFVPPPGVKRVWDGAKWIEGLQIATAIWGSGATQALFLQNNVWCDDGTYDQHKDQSKLVQGCKLQFHVFDVIRYGGKWTMDLSWKERHAIKLKVMETLSAFNPNYHLVVPWMFDAHNPLGRVELFEERLEAGDEGIMFKDEDGTYEMGKRVKHILKLKRFQTIDAVVMGWEPASEDKGWAGLVGAFKMGCYDSEGKLIEVANCSSMPLELRKQATDPETHGLRQEFYGLVAEVRFQQMTTRSFRGRHAVMVKWRTDKEARACLLDQVKEAPSEVMEGAF